MRQSNSLMNQGHWQSKNLTLQVPMPQFLFLTTTSRHDARLSSTTHCALRASRINNNLTNLSRMYTHFLQVLFLFSFQCFLVILQALSLPKSPSFSSDSPGSLCQSHQTFHKKQISRATQPQHNITCSSAVDTYFTHAHHSCQELHRLCPWLPQCLIQCWVQRYFTHPRLCDIFLIYDLAYSQACRCNSASKPMRLSFNIMMISQVASD